MNPLSAESRAIRRLKKQQPLVEALDAELWATLIPHITLREIAAGDTLFRSGQESENLYLVTDGELGLNFSAHETAEPLLLQTRVRGQTAGDFAVLNGGKHLVTATARKKTRLACFPRFAFELLTDIDPNILAHVYDTAAQLSRRVMLARVYTGLFGQIEVDTLNKLLEGSTVQHLKNAEILFEEGDEADGLHVVISGRLIVETTGSDNEPVVLAEVSAHETVGEYALLSGSKRSATVYATRESMVALLPREKFDELILSQPDLLASVARLIVRRQMLHAKSEVKRAPISNYVVIPLDSRLPLRRFIPQLKNEFKLKDTPLVLDSNLFDTMYGKKKASTTTFSDIFSNSISAWMDDKENYFSHVIYVADQRWNAWTKRCVNRADLILLVAKASDDNDTTQRAIEEQLFAIYENAKFRPRIELVLLHSPDTVRPSGTEDWIRYRDINAFHHIRLGDRKHTARLYRRMTGKARGLVFSGGGARGYAHLGVHRAIEEHDFDVDYIGGSSMGGLLGAAMALGLSANQVYEFSERFANARALFDYTLPVSALMQSKKLTDFCHTVYADARIEDLWIPFFCVSSNLSDGREVIHKRGYLWKAVRSTVSLPGIFSPVPTLNGELLIDGAVLNTFPVDIMHAQLAGGSIIGVNVSQIPEIREFYNYGTSLSGWKIFMHRINPFADKIRTPKIAETLLRATDIKSIQRLNETRRMLDTLIEPDVSSIPLLEFKSFRKISEIGYEEANRVLFQPVKTAITDAEKLDDKNTQSGNDGTTLTIGTDQNPESRASTQDNSTPAPAITQLAAPADDDQSNANSGNNLAADGNVAAN